MNFLQTKFLLALACLVAVSSAAATWGQRPNIIYILSDDLAQGDCGSYGQKLIATPNLDRMAREGTRYLQAYTGTSVCAPARASLLTGLHMGHSSIRANREIRPEGQRPLPAEAVTVAKLLKHAGYATAAIGKWGMGMFDTTGSPLRQGFDRFYGYNCQRHAHSYFPTYLYDDDRRFELPGNTGSKEHSAREAIYAQDLIADEALRWVRTRAGEPFFLYYAITLPHGSLQIDDQGGYKDRPWTEEQKTYAAMVTRLDQDVGRLLALLAELRIDQNTLVMFSGDNGSSFDAASDLGRLFDQSLGGRLRGAKRTLYEGGLRQAAFAWWPGTVPAGRVSDEPWAFWDFLPTAAELAGVTLPSSHTTDGLSLVSFLRGGPAPRRDYFYWELHEGTSLQAVRWGDWKAVRNGPSRPIEVYDLRTDAAESRDLASSRSELVAQAAGFMRAARVDHPEWPLVEKKK
jgi:arylsulfatase A-like enzyme